MRALFYSLALIGCLVVQSQEQYYHKVLLRAKPGSLLELIDQLKEKASENTIGEGDSYILRHSQGDHWDIMLIYPVQDIHDYFSEFLQLKRAMSKPIIGSYGSEWFDLVSFQEEAFVTGPEIKEFQDLFKSSDLFHIEIFTSLPGLQTKLYEEREMENVYLMNINRKPNLIFTRVFGPSWDTFTIGGYQDMHDFAGPEITIEEED